MASNIKTVGSSHYSLLNKEGDVVDTVWASTEEEAEDYFSNDYDLEDYSIQGDW